MFGSLSFREILSQISEYMQHIRLFVFPYSFALLLRKGFVLMHTWHCICVHYWHIENNLKTALARGLYAKGM